MTYEQFYLNLNNKYLFIQQVKYIKYIFIFKSEDIRKKNCHDREMNFLFHVINIINAIVHSLFGIIEPRNGLFK